MVKKFVIYLKLHLNHLLTSLQERAKGFRNPCKISDFAHAKGCYADVVPRDFFLLWGILDFTKERQHSLLNCLWKPDAELGEATNLEGKINYLVLKIRLLRTNNYIKVHMHPFFHREEQHLHFVLISRSKNNVIFLMNLQVQLGQYYQDHLLSTA